MSDYNRYRKSVSIENGDMVNALSEKYPRFSRIQACMINHPEAYGVKLIPEAEHILAEKFGFGSGLGVKAKKTRQVKRTKSRSLAVRLDDEHYDRVKNKMQEMGCTSVQSFLEEILKDI